MTPWYTTWFESPWYLRLYQHRTDDEARKAVDLVKHVVRIPTRARILDLACGYGRHAMALAENGYDVVGLDSSNFLMERARSVYDHPNVSYLHADMRDAIPEAPYDVIVNFFTSFGYFEDDADNERVVYGMFSALKPGGTLVVDYLNARYVRERMEPETMSRIDGSFVIQERRIEDPFMIKDITITSGCAGDMIFQERVRLYDAQQLCTKVEDAGFVIDHLAGNYDATPFNEETSPRCIILAHRPGH